MMDSTRYSISQPNKNRGLLTWFGVITQNGKRKKKSLKTTSKKEALRWLEKQNAQKYLPEHQRERTVKTFSEVLPLYRRHLEAVHGGVRKTLEAYKLYLSHFENWIDNDKCISKFSNEDAQNYLDSLTNLSPKTIGEHYKFLKKMFALWIDYKHIFINPFNKDWIQLPKIIHKERSFWTLDEIKTILGRVPTKHKPFWTTLAHTGMRFQEGITLTFDNIDFDKKNITIHGKGGKIRIIPINANLYPILVEERSRYRYGLCFPDMPQTEYGCLKALQKALKGLYFQKSGSNNIHRFRHSFASNLLRGGAQIKAVSLLLGHSNIKITLETYGHLLPNDFHDAVKILETNEETIIPFQKLA